MSTVLDAPSKLSFHCVSQANRRGSFSAFKSSIRQERFEKVIFKSDGRMYPRLQSPELLCSSIGKQQCPQVVSIYSNNTAEEANIYPIAIKLSEKRFLPEAVLKAAGESSEFFFVVQNSYEGESLHCEHAQALFTSSDIQELRKDTPLTRKGMTKNCTIEIFTTNPNLTFGGNVKMTLLNSATSSPKEESKETKDLVEVPFTCKLDLQDKITESDSTVVLKGYNYLVGEHFISVVKVPNKPSVITYHWLLPENEIVFLCNELALAKKEELDNINKLIFKFESLSREHLCYGFLQEPFSTLKKLNFGTFAVSVSLDKDKDKDKDKEKEKEKESQRRRSLSSHSSSSHEGDSPESLTPRPLLFSPPPAPETIRQQLERQLSAAPKPPIASPAPENSARRKKKVPPPLPTPTTAAPRNKKRPPPLPTAVKVN